MNHEITENLVIGDIVAYEGRWHVVVEWNDAAPDLNNSSVRLHLRRLDTEDESECVALPDAAWRMRQGGSRDNG